MRNLSIAVPFLVLALPISLARTSEVSINEIAWMGTVFSYNNEWIELYNSTDQEIDLKGWNLKTADEKIEITLSGKIGQNGFYLLERSNDETIPEITADQIYTGALGNGGEKLGLSDSLGKIVDSADCQNGWMAGDNSTKQTMERVGLNEWQNSEKIGGTPKFQNSIVKNISQETEEITKNNTEVYPQGIIFSEIIPSPVGQDEENEWIEILNQNDSEVDLTGWIIEDLIGQTERYVFPGNTVVKPKEYLIISRLVTKITLNNTGDGLRLLWPDEKIVDSVDFGDAPNGQSYGLLDGQWQWISSPTPGTKNTAPAVKEENIDSASASDVSVPESLVKNNINPILADISTITKSYSFLLPLTISLVTAISASVIILVIKRKFRKK